MTIVINCTHFIHSAGNDFFNAYLLQTAAAKPEHQFIFITPVAISSQSINSANIINIVSFPKANNPLLWKLWLDYQLPSIARKHKAEMIVHTGGVCSLRSAIPQWLFTSDLSFLHFPAFFSKKQLYFLKKNTPAFLSKANHIVTASAFLEKEISDQYPKVANKITAVQLSINNVYQPMGWKEKELIKERYTQGKEYFLFSGEIHSRNNLVNLLKAFSFFKKRQKSNMQLIITGKTIPGNDRFIETFKTYKYRDAVKLLMDLPGKDIPEITAAAYAFVYPSLYEGTAIFPLQAMQCEVPVITTNTGAIKEAIGDAALYADPLIFEDIADKMMLVFKDENLRADLINRGRKGIAAARKETTIEEAFWKCIENPPPG
ncbi:MAG: glycosyltransferase family 4 protein [Ferruginibacter sp.]|nr:glycosyltransferase family 4 protein [Ferruginibacter sp.]